MKLMSPENSWRTAILLLLFLFESLEFCWCRGLSSSRSFGLVKRITTSCVDALDQFDFSDWDTGSLELKYAETWDQLPESIRHYNLSGLGFFYYPGQEDGGQERIVSKKPSGLGGRPRVYLYLKYFCHIDPRINNLKVKKSLEVGPWAGGAEKDGIADKVLPLKGKKGGWMEEMVELDPMRYSTTGMTISTSGVSPQDYLVIDQIILVEGAPQYSIEIIKSLCVFDSPNDESLPE